MNQYKLVLNGILLPSVHCTRTETSALQAQATVAVLRSPPTEARNLGALSAIRAHSPNCALDGRKDGWMDGERVHLGSGLAKGTMHPSDRLARLVFYTVSAGTLASTVLLTPLVQHRRRRRKAREAERLER